MNPDDIIDSLGGTTAVARILGIKPPSVHEWRKRSIPEDKLARLAPLLESKGIATRKNLLPKTWHEIWPELANQADTAA